jgi:Porin subfamily
MTKVKNLLLGSAGAAVVLTAASAAMAADAPSAMAREPVYRCEDTGFWEIPGTDTCLRISGYMRANYTWVEDGFDGGAIDPSDLIIPEGHTENNTTEFRSRVKTRFDARTQTEYGLLRGYADLEWNEGSNNAGGGQSVTLVNGYIQFGNWLFGRAGSLFDYGAGIDTLTGTDIPGDFGGEASQIRYTQPFGNGFSAAISLEDPEGKGRDSLNGSSTIGAFNSRNEVPDVVANLSARGDWGYAQIIGAYHQSSFINAPAPVSTREDGWAATAAAGFNLPTGEGDIISAAVTYSDGAGKYNNPAPTDYTFNGVTLESVEVLSISGNFTHNWSPVFATSIGAGWADVDYGHTDAVVAGLLAVTGPAGGSGATENEFAVYLTQHWRPVANLDMAVQVQWNERELVGLGNNDADGFGVGFQVQRNF